MGRYWFKKQEADNLKKISISLLKKYGFLDNGWHFGTITWSSGGEETGSITVRSSVSEDGGRYVRFTYTQTDRLSGKKGKP